MDDFRSWWRFIDQEFKEIFEGNKQGIEGKSRTLTQFITFQEHKSVYRVEQYMHEENRSRFTNSKHFLTHK